MNKKVNILKNVGNPNRPIDFHSKSETWMSMTEFYFLGEISPLNFRSC